MSHKKQWIIISSGDRPLEEVSEALEKKGFTIESKLEAIGQLVGTATDAAKTSAQTIKGVADIQPSSDINIAPPGSDMTW